MLERLSAGYEPDARTLAHAPLAEAWATIPGEDMYRIGAVVVMPPEVRARPRIVPLLAIDRDEKWALVMVDRQMSWWVLGDPLPDGSAPEDGAEVIRLAAAWVRRWLQDS